MADETEEQKDQEEETKVEETKAEEIAVEETEEKKEKAQTDQKEKPVDKMTATELREIAIDIPGVTGVHAMKKDELLKIVKEARGIVDEAPAKAKKPKGPKKEINVKDLKKKILQLKEEKKAARMGKDKKKLHVFRRRINRLKKLTRKAIHA